MENYVKSSKDLDLISRMDYGFWAPRKEFNSEYETKTIEECVGRDNLTASAFYPSIVPYYTSLEDAIKEDTEPFIRVTDARSGLLDYTKTVFLANQVLDDNKSSIKRVKPGDIVITKGGEYIGEATLVPDYYDEYGTCRDILCINMGESSISGEYLASFLQSEYGKNELIRTKSVQGQPHLTLDKVAKLIVPIYDQDFKDEIARCWELFFEQIDSSNMHLENARSIFDDAMQRKIENKRSIISFAEVMKSSDFAIRFDVDYYERKWSNLVEELKASGIKFKPIKYVKQNFEAENPRELFYYITLSDIDDKSGIVKRLKQMEAHELPDRAKRMTQKGDVLVSSLKGSKEKIAIMNSELNNVVASTGFYVVRDSEYLPEVLYLIFRSKYYDMFIEQMSSGAIMSSLTDKYFKQFVVPELSSEIQSEIAEEVQMYMNDRQSAFENLNRAVSMFDIKKNS